MSHLYFVIRKKATQQVDANALLDEHPGESEWLMLEHWPPLHLTCPVSIVHPKLLQPHFIQTPHLRTNKIDSCLWESTFVEVKQTNKHKQKGIKITEQHHYWVVEVDTLMQEIKMQLCMLPLPLQVIVMSFLHY